MSEMTKWEALAAPFPFTELEIKAQSVSRDQDQALAAPYFDARAVRRRLNEVLGPENWRCSVTPFDKGVLCRLEVRIDGEWTWCEDGAGFSDIESVKGGISGAFKRAFSARCNDSLYEIELGWFPCEKRNDGKFKKWTPGAMKSMEKAYCDATKQEKPKIVSTNEPSPQPKATITRLVKDMGIKESELNNFKRICTSQMRDWQHVLLCAHEDNCRDYDQLIEYTEATKPQEAI